MVEKARALYEELRLHVSAEYDDSGAIGRRYRRQDEIGTPWAFTIDEQTLEDGSITLRDRDSLAQERLPLEAAREQLLARLHTPWSPPPARSVNRPGFTLVSIHMATSPSFTPALASLGDVVPHDGLLTPEELERVAIDMAAQQRALGAARARRPRPPPVRAPSTRTSAWTPGCSPGCPARRRATTTTTSPASGSVSPRASVREDLLVYGGEDVALRLRTRVTRAGAGPATSTACGTRTVARRSRSTSTRRGSTGSASTGSATTASCAGRSARDATS